MVSQVVIGGGLWGFPMRLEAASELGGLARLGTILVAEGIQQASPVRSGLRQLQDPARGGAESHARLEMSR
eukprot:646548-Amphidinium_carterae.1